MVFHAIFNLMSGQKNKKALLIFFGVLFISNVLIWSIVLKINGSEIIEVNFFDVGQGDSVFIEIAEGYQILIDGGPSSAVLEKLGNEMPFWDRSIDLVISSHPDPDHLLGLIDVLKKYDVGLVVTNGTLSSKPEFLEFQNQISKNKINTAVIKKDQKILIGKNLYFETLGPLEDFEGKEVTDFNGSSIIVRMVYFRASFLFTGDTTKSIEESLIKGGVNLSSDVLKVAHHGSKTAESEIFFSAVNPEFAVISVGKDNQYGHPNSEVLESLEKFGIKVLRTDIEGDIKIISDGKNLKIN